MKSQEKDVAKGLLTDEHRAWIGKSEPARSVEVSRRDIIKYSVATQQRQQLISFHYRAEVP